MRRRRRTFGAEFSLSFLDAICCGFGGIVLLLVLTKIGEPRALEQARIDLDAQVAALQEELFEIRGETAIFERELSVRQEQLSEIRLRIARLQGDLSRIRGELAASSQDSQVAMILEGKLLAAQQELTEEMKRLQERTPASRPVDAPVGGIPVDSEYIIFVIDTSGSMQQYAWPMVQRKMTEVLDVYPTVKGLQVMNDMGQYMFSSYRGKWIPDTPGRRRTILGRLRSWSPFSNSSPVEGIRQAISTYARGDRKISIYVFGDEFTGGSIQEVLDAVDRINLRTEDGSRRVRIHAVGFPTIFSTAGVGHQTGIRYATLMRLLCERNEGAFVGLSSLR